MAIQGGSGGGGGRSASDVRAGGAFFEIYAKDGLTGVINKLTAKVQSFASSMRRIGGTLFGAGAALGAGPLGFLLGGISRAGDIANLSRQFQVPIDLMQRLKYAADAAGTSVEDVMRNPAKFADLIAEAPIANTGDIARAMELQKEWRLTIQALQNAMLSMLDVINPYVKLFTEFVQKNAAAIAIVGGVAVGLLALGAAFTVVGTALSIVTALFTALYSPMGLLLASAIGLAVYFRGELAGAFRGTGTVFQETWKGISDAVKSGNLELAFQVMASGVTVIWYRMLDNMGKAFADWIERNQKRLVILGALLGAAGGGFLGARAGPWGALIGAALGGTAGGFGTNYLANELKELGRANYQDRINNELERLHSLTAQAAAGVPPPPNLPAIVRAVEAVKGGFNANLAQQQFGYGDKAGKLIDVNREILAEMRVNPDKIVGGLADVLRAK